MVGCDHPETEHPFFREIAVQELKRYKDSYEHAIDTSFEDFITKTSRDRECGGEVECLALCNALQIRALIRKTGRLEHILGPEEYSRVIELAYLCQNHYEVLIEAEDTSVPDTTDGIAQHNEKDIEALLTETEEILNQCELKRKEEDTKKELTLTGLFQMAFIIYQFDIHGLIVTIRCNQGALLFFSYEGSEKPPL